MIYGRVLPVDMIRKVHLEHMGKMGLLRQTVTAGLSRDECRQILKNRGGEIQHYTPCIKESTMVDR